jgi:hypothetical protein
MNQPRTLRASLVLFRAAVVAGMAVVLGAAAHVSADGLMPSHLTLLVLGLLCLGGSVPMLTGPASRLRVLGLLAGGQAFIHVGLTVTAGHRGDAVVGVRPRAVPALPPARRTGSLFDQYQALQHQVPPAGRPGGPAGSVGVDPVAHLWQHLAEQSPWMLVTHSLAVLLVALWLAAGESALCTLLVLSGSRVFAWVLSLLTSAAAHTLVLGAVSPSRGAVRLRARRVAAPVLHLARRVVAHRGPPAHLAS